MIDLRERHWIGTSGVHRDTEQGTTPVDDLSLDITVWVGCPVEIRGVEAEPEQLERFEPIPEPAATENDVSKLTPSIRPATAMPSSFPSKEM